MPDTEKNKRSLDNYIIVLPGEESPEKLIIYAGIKIPKGYGALRDPKKAT